MENVNFIDEKEKELFARAQLSQQTQDFLASAVGRYLHGRAKAEVEAAQVEALKCNPETWLGRKRLKKLRASAGIAYRFMSWCTEAIADGEMAYQELREYRNTANI